MTDETTTAPRRLRAQDVIDAQQKTIDQLTTRTSAEPYVTVEHTLNAKGDTQTTVKVTAPLGCDVDTLTVFAQYVETLSYKTYTDAIGRYPRTNGETK